MLSPQKYPDYHYVPEEHKAIDDRLVNWADYVRVKHPSWVGPIWKLGKSNGRQWHQPEYRRACDTLDGQRVEEAVRELPRLHCAAIRWCYVFRTGEIPFRRKSGLTRDGLFQVLNDARAMLIHRRV